MLTTPLFRRLAPKEAHEIGPLGVGYKLYSKRAVDAKPGVSTGSAAGPLGQGYMLYGKRDNSVTPKVAAKHSTGPSGVGDRMHSKRDVMDPSKVVNDEQVGDYFRYE